MTLKTYLASLRYRITGSLLPPSDLHSTELSTKAQFPMSDELRKRYEAKGILPREWRSEHCVFVTHDDSGAVLVEEQPTTFRAPVDYDELPV